MLCNGQRDLRKHRGSSVYQLSGVASNNHEYSSGILHNKQDIKWRGNSSTLIAKSGAHRGAVDVELLVTGGFHIHLFLSTMVGLLYALI